MPKLVVVHSTLERDPAGLPRPIIGEFAKRVYADIQPITVWDPDNDYDLMKFIGAVGEIFQEIDTLVMEDVYNIPWSALVDIDRCPDWALPWLAQFVGITKIPRDVDTIILREYIKSVGNWGRGRPSAIKAATRLHLEGNRNVYLDERWGGAYRLRVTTLDSETPDPDRTLIDVITQKPAAIILNYRVIAGQTYQTLYDNNADYDEVFSKYATYDGVFDDDPGA